MPPAATVEVPFWQSHWFVALAWGLLLVLALPVLFRLLAILLDPQADRARRHAALPSSNIGPRVVTQPAIVLSGHSPHKADARMPLSGGAGLDHARKNCIPGDGPAGAGPDPRHGPSIRLTPREQTTTGRTRQETSITQAVHGGPADASPAWTSASRSETPRTAASTDLLADKIDIAATPHDNAPEEWPALIATACEPAIAEPAFPLTSEPSLLSVSRFGSRRIQVTLRRWA